MSILLVLSLFVISDISLNTFQPNSHTAHAAPGEGYTGTANSDKDAKKENNKEENKDKAPSSVVPRVEESYGTFVVTSDLEEIAIPVTPTEPNPTSAAGAAQ